VRRRAIDLIVVLAMLVGAAPAGAHEGDGVEQEQEQAVEQLDVRLVPRGDRVALTFDDGPHPRWTPVILDILDEYEITATFFVSGWRIDNHPEILADVVRRGHSVQPHGWNHVRMTRYSSPWVQDDLERNIAQIVDAGGARSTCWRPPYGVSNRRVRGVASGLGLDTVLWDADSYDYAHASAALSVHHVLDDLEAGDVILMHDLYGFIHDESLPQIIEAIRARGLRFDTICDDRPVQRFEVKRLVRPTRGPI
jgi:peptidoglycan/xylan/chitin deacetylase (PgdA/CDA1 family)